MQTTVTPNAISTVLSNPSFDSSSEDRSEIVVQVVDLKAIGNRYTFSANDGTTKIKAMFTPSLTPEIISGKIQNLGLIRLIDFAVNDIPSKSTKYFLVTKCEPVGSALDSEISLESKSEEEASEPKRQKLDHSPVNDVSTGITLKPKQEFVAKSASQIISEERGNAAPPYNNCMFLDFLKIEAASKYSTVDTLKQQYLFVAAKYKNMKESGGRKNRRGEDDEESERFFGGHKDNKKPSKKFRR